MVAAGSSGLVVRHRSSALTGRYMKLQVKPLDFREHLTFAGREYDSFETALMEGFMEDYPLALKKRGIRHRVMVTRREQEVPDGLMAVPLWKLAAECIGIFEG